MATVEVETGIQFDNVRALPYICPQIMQSFIKRPRDHGWPSNGQLIEISTLENTFGT